MRVQQSRDRRTEQKPGAEAGDRGSRGQEDERGQEEEERGTEGG